MVWNVEAERKGGGEEDVGLGHLLNDRLRDLDKAAHQSLERLTADIAKRNTVEAES